MQSTLPGRRSSLTAVAVSLPPSFPAVSRAWRNPSGRRLSGARAGAAGSGGAAEQVTWRFADTQITWQAEVGAHSCSSTCSSSSYTQCMPLSFPLLSLLFSKCLTKERSSRLLFPTGSDPMWLGAGSQSGSESAANPRSVGCGCAEVSGGERALCLRI